MTNVLTPVGRLVAGSPWVPQTKDQQGNPLVYKTGEKTGQPRVTYYLGLAVEKTNPDVNALITVIHTIARAGFPKLFDAMGGCLHSDFAFKYVDGDSEKFNKAGNRWCDKEGYPGHWVFNFSSSIIPTIVSLGGAEILTDPESFKLGSYCRIYGDVRSNDSTAQPGVYLNYYPKAALEVVRYGPEIQTGPTPEQAFATPIGSLPDGASTVPIISTPPIARAVSVTAPVTAPVTPPVTPPVVPAMDYLAAPQLPSKVYNIDGQVVTREQLLGWGWTPAQIDNLPN